MPNSSRKVPDLVGVKEAAEILGMPEQQVSYMARRRLEGDTKIIPEPVAVLAMGTIWLKSDIEAFRDGPRRGRGRPAGPAKGRVPATLSRYDPELVGRAIDSPDTSLTDRERKLLRYRMGLEGGEVLDLASAAEKLGVSIHTARQDQRRANKKMQALLQSA